MMGQRMSMNDEVERNGKNIAAMWKEIYRLRKVIDALQQFHDGEQRITMKNVNGKAVRVKQTFSKVELTEEAVLDA